MLFVIYMAEYAVFGFSAWGWHLVNVLMHSVNSVLVFLILRHLLEAENKGYTSTLPAFAGALIFSIHPTNAESVSWLATMAELTFTFLCLAAFYIEARSIDVVSGCVIERAASKVVPALFFLAALLLKETAVVLPLIVFVYDGARKGFKGSFSWARLSRYLPYVAMAVVYTAMRAFALKGEMTPGTRLHAFLSPYEFALNAIVLLARYFKALVLPVGEPPLQLMDTVMSLSEPRAAISAFAVVAVPLALAVVLRRITRLWVLILAIIILPILPTLYSPAISRFPYADRYLYFSTVGLAMLIAVVLGWHGARHGQWGRLALIAVIAAALPFAALARQKSAPWESDRALWGAALAAQPHNYVAVHSIASDHLRDGRPVEAVKLFEDSLKANLSSEHPDESMVLLTRKVLPQAYIKAGLEAKAEVGLEEYLKLMPEDASSFYNLALIKQRKGACADAVELYQRAAVFTKDSELAARAHYNMGECYLSAGMRTDALRSFQEALRYAPGDSLILERIDSLEGPGARP
jgi:tetratricopeptide (TPR) repeat protein